MKDSLKYSIFLLIGAVIWGSAFVAQSAGMDYVGPFTFTCIRNVLGSLVLVPTALAFDKINGVSTKWTDKRLFIGGGICGALLFLAASAQQIGIMTTAAGKSGFITALYIVLVPIFSIVLKKKPSKLIWVCVVMALIGLYFLCIEPGSISIQSGDIWLFACAILFSFQILAIDKFAPDLDAIKLSCYEFAATAILALIPMFLEKPVMGNVLACWLPIGFAGIFSSGIAYTFQTIGQKKVKPTVASLLMSLESVFSVIFGFLILHERLSGRELTGCIIMFAAVILSQVVPAKEEK